MGSTEASAAVADLRAEGGPQGPPTPTPGGLPRGLVCEEVPRGLGLRAGVRKRKEETRCDTRLQSAQRS